MHNLYRHLAACDLAVVQGGLTTSMELTANKRPFLYFPLRHHFEQNFHVRHRLERYGAGRRMDYDDSPPERIAEAIAQEIGREVQLPRRGGRRRRQQRPGASPSCCTTANLARPQQLPNTVASPGEAGVHYQLRLRRGGSAARELPGEAHRPRHPARERDGDAV